MGKIYRQLSLEERCAIARFHEDGQSIRQIAAPLDRAASTISRELARNKTYGRQRYKPVRRTGLVNSPAVVISLSPPPSSSSSGLTRGSRKPQTDFL